jgi:hypothetical protein
MKISFWKKLFSKNIGASEKKIQLNELYLQYQGTKFRELVEHHLDVMDATTRQQAINCHVNWLPEKLRPLTEKFLDRWLLKVLEPDFFEQDTSLVFKAIIEDARTLSQEYDPSDDDLFHIFNIVVMSFAMNVVIHRTDFL